MITLKNRFSAIVIISVLSVFSNLGIVSAYADFLPLNDEDKFNDINYTPDPEVSAHTYSLILNGGPTTVQNRWSFYNSARFFYCTLRNGYKIPADHFRVIISDGTDPGVDMVLYDQYKSSPLDLDGDGLCDINYSATKPNICQALKELDSIMSPGDHLILFVTGHGNNGDGIGYTDESTISLWRNENSPRGKTGIAGSDDYELYDYELEQMLDSTLKPGIRVSAIMSQCHSGGFVDNFQKKGYSIMTSCSAAESVVVSGMTDNFEKFHYQVTCALRGLDENGRALNPGADFNGDGRVTLEEAFLYAEKQLSAYDYTEMWSATPAGMGDYALNHLPGSDLYLESYSGDTGGLSRGEEKLQWDSPDIWIRPTADDRSYHVNPNFSSEKNSVSVYVRVHNRSVDPSSEGEYLHCYWSLGSSSVPGKVWSGGEKVEGIKTGGQIGIVPIPPINGGDSVVVRLDWVLPDEVVAYLQNRTVPESFSILAKVSKSSKTESTSSYDHYRSLCGNRKVALRTHTVIDTRDLSRGAKINLRGIQGEAYSLEIRQRPGKDGKGIFSKAEVLLSLPTDLYGGWTSGGSCSNGLARVPAGVDPRAGYNSDDGLLDKVIFPVSSPGAVTVSLRPTGRLITSNYWKDAPYIFDLIQRDEAGMIVGGATFRVEESYAAELPVDSLTMDGNIILKALEVDPADRVYWHDDQWEIKGYGDSYAVPCSGSSGELTAVSVSSDGTVRSGSATLSRRTGLRAAGYSAGYAEVEIYGEVPAAGAYLRVVSVSSPGAENIMIPVENGRASLRISMSGFPDGIFTIGYYQGTQLLDSVQLIKR